MSSIENIAVLHFHPRQRERFNSGELREMWLKQYPELFDADDERLAVSQQGAHFYEWLGAVVMHQTTGYLSLIEKYQFRKHKLKRKKLEQIVPRALIEFFDGGQKERFGSLQAPDLLMYAPDYSDWFFCEIKGPTDRLRSEQREYFEAIAELCRKKVGVLRFRELKL